MHASISRSTVAALGGSSRLGAPMGGVAEKVRRDVDVCLVADTDEVPAAALA